jgi:signal peptidase I
VLQVPITRPLVPAMQSTGWNGRCSRIARPCLLGGAVLLAASLSPWRFGIAVGSSMDPTLASGQPFLYDRGYYGPHPLLKGDVIVLNIGGETWVKRVYAGPGAQFWAFRERDGRAVRTSPVRPADRERFSTLGRRWKRGSQLTSELVRITLGPNQVFLMGDGAYSFDSREWGPVPADQVLGRVLGAGVSLAALRGMELTFPTRPRRLQPRLPRGKGPGAPLAVR